MTAFSGRLAAPVSASNPPPPTDTRTVPLVTRTVEVLPATGRPGSGNRSHASPIRSPSTSRWSAFATTGQLSTASAAPSASPSGTRTAGGSGLTGATGPIGATRIWPLIAHTATPRWSGATAARVSEMPSPSTSTVPDAQLAPSSDVAWIRCTPSASKRGKTACRRPAASWKRCCWASSPPGEIGTPGANVAPSNLRTAIPGSVPAIMNKPEGPPASRGKSA